MIRRLTCPICEKELPVEVDGDAAIFPFCSPQCKQVDLYRWMSGSYAVDEQLTPERVMEEIAKQELPHEFEE